MSVFFKKDLLCPPRALGRKRGRHRWLQSSLSLCVLACESQRSPRGHHARLDLPPNSSALLCAGGFADLTLKDEHSLLLAFLRGQCCEGRGRGDVRLAWVQGV